MSMRDKEADHLDALIDDTARAMTAATPPVSLRAAVRERIGRPARTPWRWQAALAAASIVLIAIIGGRGWLSVTSEPESVRNTVEEGIATAAPAAARNAEPAPVADAPRTTVVRGVAVNPAPPPEPIAIEPLVLDLVDDPMVLAVESIAAPLPLDVMPIVVEPLLME
jgi:hypothetical protein